MALFDDFSFSNLLKEALGPVIPPGPPPGNWPPTGAAPGMPMDPSQAGGPGQLPAPTPAPPPAPAAAPPPAAIPDATPITNPPMPTPDPRLAGLPPGTQLFPPSGRPQVAQAPGLPPVQQIPSSPIAAPPPGTQPPPGGPRGVGPFMSNIFGRDPRLAMQNVNSIAEGLKAVGQNWNKPGLAAFAGSAGAAMGGGAKGDKEYFGELAQAVKINDAYNTAQTRADLARAKLEWQQKVGSISGRASAWQLSEAGRFDMAERRVQARVETERKSLQDTLKNGSPAEQAAAQKQIKDLEAQLRKQFYPRYGLSPDKTDDYENAGQPVFKTDKDGKRVLDVDATRARAHKPKNYQDFNGQGPNGEYSVPPGSYFVDPKSGKLLKRSSEVPQAYDDPSNPITAARPELAQEGDEDTA